MNISTKGIQSKIEKYADYIAFLLSANDRMSGDWAWVANQYLKGGFIKEATHVLGNMKSLKYRLWDSPHAYTGLFKLGLGLYIGSEIGLIKKKSLAMKIMKGAAFSAITMPGSDPTGSPSDSGLLHGHHAFESQFARSG